MLGMAGMGEGMVQDRIGETSIVKCRGQGEERVVSAHDVVDALSLDHGLHYVVSLESRRDGCSSLHRTTKERTWSRIRIWSS